jgi:hypothetical protein
MRRAGARVGSRPFCESQRRKAARASRDGPIDARLLFITEDGVFGSL